MRIASSSRYRPRDTTRRDSRRIEHSSRPRPSSSVGAPSSPASMTLLYINIDTAFATIEPSFDDIFDYGIDDSPVTQSREGKDEYQDEYDDYAK